MIDFYEQIGAYLEDKLTPEERSAFEIAMSNDPELKEALDNHDIVDEALDHLVEEDIRSTIKKVEHRENEEGSKQKQLPKYGIITYLLFALGLGLLALIAYFIKKQKTPPAAELYATYYAPFLSPTERGNETKTLSLCDEGHAAMEKSNLDDAKQLLVTAASTNNNCTDKAQWYLSLIYLFEEEEVKRDSLLALVTEDDDSIYQKRASDLVTDLSN